jgi:hypothetical protein
LTKWGKKWKLKGKKWHPSMCAVAVVHLRAAGQENTRKTDRLKWIHMGLDLIGQSQLSHDAGFLFLFPFLRAGMCLSSKRDPPGYPRLYATDDAQSGGDHHNRYHYASPIRTGQDKKLQLSLIITPTIGYTILVVL